MSLLNVKLYFIFFVLSLAASVVGSICGIGGGVILKPLLDSFGVLDVATISLLSGCTVFAMSGYSILKNAISKKSLVDKKYSTILAIGAVAGGTAGKWMFNFLTASFSDKNFVGAVQAMVLFLITLSTIVYTVNQKRVTTLKVKNSIAGMCIGLLLGVSSSFLGIGGGPINLMVLSYFFSMETKVAAQNSLYIILFSQAASIFLTILSRTVPEVSVLLVLIMTCGGIFGSIIGQKVNKKISSEGVSKLFVVVMAVILVICVYNIIRFLMMSP